MCYRIQVGSPLFIVINISLSKRSFCREEAERKRQQELENARRQKEEMEREQEALRKKMIEDRLV